MEFFENETQMEKYLQQKCADTYQPFSGVLELTPECNLDCKFCYVHQSHRERISTGELLDADHWISIIDQAYEMGVYSFLITGGEPLLHPEFRKIYTYLTDKGICTSLNSNGTLMNEEYIQFFQKHGCRRFNISLYGIDNETYEKLCGVKNGFDRVMHTLELFKAYHLPVKISVSLTPQNISQVAQINQIAENLGFPIQFSSYMFPGSRRGICAEEQYRLSPEQAAEASIRCFHIKNPNVDYEASCRYSLSKLVHPRKYSNPKPGFVCYAAKCTFWISWNGRLSPCGMFNEESLQYDLLESTFADCWHRMTADARKSSCRCKECTECDMRDLCQSCPASCLAETGRMDQKPEYLCRMTGEMVRICKEALEDAVSRVPLVSIVVPVYNVEKYIDLCVESFLKQKLTTWELILVDDGSTDRSGEICDRYAGYDGRIKVIHQQNAGVSAARNRGLEAASADYILFCDSDDFVEKDFCRVLYHKIKGRENTFISANTWVGNDACPREITIGVDYTDPDHITVEQAKGNAVFAYVWNKIYSKKIISDHKIRFDESCSYGEDVKFNCEYIRYCSDAAFITEPLCVHLNHAEGLAQQGLRRSGKTLKDVEIGDFTGVRRVKMEEFMNHWQVRPEAEENQFTSTDPKEGRPYQSLDIF